MTPEEEKELTEHIDAYAKIFYRQTQPEQVETKRQNRGNGKKTNTSVYQPTNWIFSWCATRCVLRRYYTA